MPTLLLRFPGGRYHATPPGTHVNEGIVEWPPSPWRLVRALLACGFNTQHWSQGVPHEARRLIEALAGVLPTYRLPQATLAHSRHYMPLARLEKGREDTTLVFDPWAHVGDEAISVRWSCALGAQESRLFGTLAAHLGYLGRSESWVVAESVPDDRELPGLECLPHVDGHRPGREWEQVTTIAPLEPSDYAAWRGELVARALAPLPLPEGRVPKALLKKRAAAEAPYPADLVECLQLDTRWWKQHRWSQPPGSRRVLYWRPASSFAPRPIRRPRHEAAPVQAMLLALAASSGRTGSLPRSSRTLPQAELLHRALVSSIDGSPCPELTGREPDGAPMRGHRHAHVLPVDLDGDGRLDHVLIHATMGLGPMAQAAARGVRRTWTKGRAGAIQLAIAGAGDVDDLRALPAPFDRGIRSLLGPPGGSTVWTSATPFCPPRHLKSRGKNSLEGQIQAELVARDLPAASVEVLPWDERTRHMRHFVRVRRKAGLGPPADAGFALRLAFERPVQGPLCLGYASHFGLGRFESVDLG